MRPIDNAARQERSKNSAIGCAVPVRHAARYVIEIGADWLFLLQVHHFRDRPQFFLNELFQAGPATMLAYGALRDQVGKLIRNVWHCIRTVVPSLFHGLEGYWTFLSKAAGKLRHFFIQLCSRN